MCPAKEPQSPRIIFIGAGGGSFSAVAGVCLFPAVIMDPDDLRPVCPGCEQAHKNIFSGQRFGPVRCKADFSFRNTAFGNCQPDVPAFPSFVALLTAGPDTQPVFTGRHSRRGEYELISCFVPLPVQVIIDPVVPVVFPVPVVMEIVPFFV